MSVGRSPAIGAGLLIVLGPLSYVPLAAHQTMALALLTFHVVEDLSYGQLRTQSF